MRNIEKWKSIVNYPDYQVSNLGRVKSFRVSKNGKILINSIGNTGYLSVNLCNIIGAKTKRIHKLVAIAFLHHTPNGSNIVVDHIDFNKTNNTVENLRLISSRENGNKKHLSSSSKYVGVSFYKITNKWRAQIRIKEKIKHLGYFNTEEEARNKRITEEKILEINNLKE